MKRSTIIAGAAAAGGLLASVVMPKAKFFLGAAIGAGVGATTALVATKKPPTPLPEEPITMESHRQPAFVEKGGYAVVGGKVLPIAPVFFNTLQNRPDPTADLIEDQFIDPVILSKSLTSTLATSSRYAQPVSPVILPKRLSTVLATSLANRGISVDEYRRRMASAGLKVMQQTDWAQRVKLDRRLVRRQSPYPGWLGSLVSYGASQQALYAKYLKNRRQNRFDGEWGIGHDGIWLTGKQHGGTKRWRDTHAEWPAPCDSMGTVKWMHRLHRTSVNKWDEREYGQPYQRIIQRRFVDNFLGKSKPNSEQGHWGETDWREFQIYKRAPGGEHYNWIMKHAGRFVEPNVKRNPAYMEELNHYYQIGYWLVWAAECWRINTAKTGGYQITTLLDPPEWWVRHCLAWGVGVATKERVLNRRTTRIKSGLQPSGPKSIEFTNTPNLLNLVMKHTPVPGSIPSGTELSNLHPRPILDWPVIGDAGTFRPTWNWPGGERVWDQYIEDARSDVVASSPAIQVIFIVIEVVESIIFSVLGGAVGEVAGALVATAANGVILAAINALKAFASVGFQLNTQTILSALSAATQGLGLEGMSDLALWDFIDRRIQEIDYYWGYADDLIGEYVVIPNIQEEFNKQASKVLF